jgi:hypothetical protein
MDRKRCPHKRRRSFRTLIVYTKFMPRRNSFHKIRATFLLARDTARKKPA